MEALLPRGYNPDAPAPPGMVAESDGSLNAGLNFKSLAGDPEAVEAPPAYDEIVTNDKAFADAMLSARQEARALVHPEHRNQPCPGPGPCPNPPRRPKPKPLIDPPVIEPHSPEVGLHYYALPIAVICGAAIIALGSHRHQYESLQS